MSYFQLTTPSFPYPELRFSNLPVHSFRTLLEDLGTICLNTVECTLESGKYVFDKITRPTELQQKALDLLDISSICTQ
ncbi:hypothetical protein cce_1069 [Crocosphaera subtropica ATCC 51142]|uniref:Uncharacterized protein n=1 Tax=Crocosphaera subtropica (strain ATCC 51142 / BH68) TaxID=43989 RepID=B1WTV4_CROS5|nr:hypothetical protein [Crocosphaera subtropica]ACB50420.1 hypothetical protein cce_1069 [Crocosphaera subtropica ATCC 51142]